MKAKHRLYLVDDHPLVREWLVNLFRQQADFDVCGEAEDAPAAFDEIGRLQPDTVVIDIGLRHSSGLDLVKSLSAAHPHIRQLVFSMHDEALYAERCLRAGAHGYVMKREKASQILHAIRQVMAGEVYMSSRVRDLMARKHLSLKIPSAVNPLEVLSDRELEVFRFMAEGMNSPRIAERLNLSVKTIQVYQARMKEKLKVDDITELLCEALRWKER